MLNDQKILEKLKNLPQPLKAELLHYMDTLINKHVAETETRKQPQFGSARGFYKTSEDFDAPLADFQEYMA